jgi:hypothetical protein
MEHKREPSFCKGRFTSFDGCSLVQIRFRCAGHKRSALRQRCTHSKCNRIHSRLQGEKLTGKWTFLHSGQI